MEVRNMEYASFEVVPTDETLPLVLDVPLLIDNAAERERAARRAYFTAMSLMASHGLDVEDFEVYVFDGNERGQLVTMKGLTTTA
jgi:hypothetical protein